MVIGHENKSLAADRSTGTSFRHQCSRGRAGAIISFASDIAPVGGLRAYASAGNQRATGASATSRGQRGAFARWIRAATGRFRVDIKVSQATVAKYMLRRIGMPSPTWRVNGCQPPELTAQSLLNDRTELPLAWGAHHKVLGFPFLA